MGIGFGVRGCDIIRRPPRIVTDEFECLGPVLGLQSQFGPLLTQPYCAGMGRLGLIGDNQSLRPVAALDRLAQQSTEAEKSGIFLFCESAEGLFCLILPARQPAGLGHQ